MSKEPKRLSDKNPEEVKRMIAEAKKKLATPEFQAEFDDMKTGAAKLVRDMRERQKVTSNIYDIIFDI